MSGETKWEGEGGDESKVHNVCMGMWVTGK